jgi:hypothetical protein
MYPEPEKLALFYGTNCLLKTERSNPGLDAHMYPEPEKLALFYGTN